jgi:hypothetical protein
MRKRGFMVLLSLGATISGLVWGLPAADVHGDTVIMKTGSVYRGSVDHDNTIYFIFDGLKRIVVRDSKILKMQPDSSYRNFETFRLEQPMVVHGGNMPKEVTSVRAQAWNDRGRRMFDYTGANLERRIKMEQAINELGPRVSRVRGVDGFWQGQVPTSQIPREIVLGLLGKVERKNRDERQRVYTFLVQAEWYTEAKAELDAIARDFPEIRDNVANARLNVVQLEAQSLRAEIDVRRKAQQYKEVRSRLKSFPSQDVAVEILEEIRNQVRQDDTQDAADVALADRFRAASERLSKDARATWRAPVKEILQTLKDAPDAVRDRFAAWEKANAEPGTSTEARFALAVSGYVAGPDAAVADLLGAEVLWKARDLIVQYLQSDDPDTRKQCLEDLDALPFPGDPERKDPTHRLDIATRLVERMPPPLHGAITRVNQQPQHVWVGSFAKGDEAVVELPDEPSVTLVTSDDDRNEVLAAQIAGEPKTIARLIKQGKMSRVASGSPVVIDKLDVAWAFVKTRDGDSEGWVRREAIKPASPAPTEYWALLPPEYNPLRSYPAVVALHSGDGPKAALAWWGAEAARRGYIVIVPEYRAADDKKVGELLPGYRYTQSEHAAVELAIRDARRRYAIDSDRLFLGGQLAGGDMAWDYGLAHPDEFAGISAVSGEPLKYVFRYLPHTEYLPLYVALGDLAPASNEVIFQSIVRPLIAKGWDVTYAEHYRRGREDFPEEAPCIFDWMDHRPRRNPQPKKFEVYSARVSDDRFFGTVIREFNSGRTTAPEAVEPTGRNLRPARIRMRSSTLSNLIQLDVDGIKRFDVWVSPKLIDFKKKMEIRINGKTRVKGSARLEFEPFLEDLRIRGDRQQVYWLKVPVG